MNFSRRHVLALSGATLLTGCVQTGSEVFRSVPIEGTDYNEFAQRAAQRGQLVHQVQPGETWQSLFGSQATVARFANRQNLVLEAGQMVIVPPAGATTASISPFPVAAHAGESKLVVVSPGRYAWALYEYGQLTRWGPAVCGANYCADVGRGCQTPSGRFVVSEVAGPNRRSNAYPPILAAEGKGAIMPYYMRLTAGGVGMHARYIRGVHASHGCVGMFYDDAEWLNLNHAKRGRLPVLVESYT